MYPSVTTTVGAVLELPTVIVSVPVSGGAADDLYVTIIVPVLPVTNLAGVADKVFEPTLAEPPPAVGVNEIQTTAPATAWPPASRAVR